MTPCRVALALALSRDGAKMSGLAQSVGIGPALHVYGESLCAWWCDGTSVCAHKQASKRKDIAAWPLNTPSLGK